MTVFLALIFTGVVIQLNPNAGKDCLLLLLTTLYQFDRAVKVLFSDTVHSFAMLILTFELHFLDLTSKVFKTLSIIVNVAQHKCGWELEWENC